MLNIFAHITKGAILKGAAMTLGFLGITGGTAAATFFAVPQHVTFKTVESPIAQRENGKLSGRQRFVGQLADSATNGLSITIDDLKFDQSYSDKDGHNTIEILPQLPGQLNIELSALSLHGIEFSLTAPVTYSNNGASPKHRGIHVSKVQDDIYLNLFDNGNKVLALQEDGSYEVPSTANPSWDFKYHVNVASYDESPASNDPLTRGTVRYEYGELDWLIADILEILSEGGISVSLEGWLNNLTGSTSSSEGGLDTSSLLSSMDEMIETKIVLDGKEVPYFIWNLPLGDLELPLGFISDYSSWGFKGVDLPARVDENGNESETQAVTLAEGLTLSAHATVNGGSSIDFASTVYGSPADYVELKNSAGIFQGVAKYIAKPEIGLAADFTIDHNQEAVAGTRTVLRKDKVEEQGVLSLQANIDAYDGENKKRALQGLDVNLSLGRATSSVNERNNISLTYLKEEDGFNGYLNVNDIMKAKTSQTYLDSFYAQVVNDVFGTTADQLSLDQLTGVINKLKGSLDNILASDLIKSLASSSSASIFNKDFIDSFKSGTYVGALDLIKAIKNGDNTITLAFTTDPVGIEGDIEIVLDGKGNEVVNENNEEKVIVHNLLSVNISGLKLSSFTLNGSLHTADYVAPASLDAEEVSNYESLSHLKGIASQIKTIADSKSIYAKLGLSINKGGKETLAIQNGELAFDFNKNEEGEEAKLAKGSVAMRLVHTAEKYIGTHDVVLALDNDFKDIAFHYDSHAETDEGGINGQISLNNFKEAFIKADTTTPLLAGSLISFFQEDDRFARLGAALMGEASSSLLSQIGNGEYLALLENHGILSSFSLGVDKTSLTINGNAIGLADTSIVIDVEYDASTQIENDIIEGGIKSLKVNVITTGESPKNILFTLSDIAPLGNHEVKTISNELDDFNHLATLGAHLVNTLTLGSYIDGKVAGSSSYGIHGSIDLDIAGYGTTLYDFDAEAFVEGAETKIHAKLEDFPVIRGVNAPDNDHYFRPNELEGQRTSEIFFYANGVNPEGEALILRDSSYGRLRNVQDAVRVSGSSLTGDLLGWLGKYALGLNESLFTPSEEAEEAPYEGEMGDGIHIDDAWKGFTYENGVYTISLDLGKLVGISILDEVSVKLFTKSVRNSEEAPAYTIISGVEISLGVAAKASNTGNKMSIASAKVSLMLTNFHGENNVIEPLCGIDSRFGQVFVKTSSELGDDGLIASNEATHGLMYQPIGGNSGAFKSASYQEDARGEHEFDNYYCYDFTATKDEEDNKLTFQGANFYL